MPDRHALIDVVEAAYTAFATRDSDNLLRICGTDCHWQAPGLPAYMPWVGAHRGHAGVLEFVELLDQHLEFLAFEKHALVVDAEQGQVVALGVAHCKSKATGRRYVNHWAHLFTLRDGLITDFREYPDTAAQLTAIHPALQGAASPEDIAHD